MCVTSYAGCGRPARCKCLEEWEGNRTAYASGLLRLGLTGSGKCCTADRPMHSERHICGLEEGAGAARSLYDFQYRDSDVRVYSSCRQGGSRKRIGQREKSDPPPPPPPLTQHEGRSQPMDRPTRASQFVERGELAYLKRWYAARARLGGSRDGDFWDVLRGTRGCQGPWRRGSGSVNTAWNVFSIETQPQMDCQVSRHSRLFRPANIVQTAA